MGTKHGRGKRFDGFGFDPDELVIIGRDTKDTSDHWGYDARGLRDFDEQTVIGMIRFGVLKTIGIKRDGDRDVVVFGRGVVINAREANGRLKRDGQPTLLVPATIQKGDNASLFEIARIENTHRFDENPLELEAAARKLRDKYKRSVEDIAVDLHKPVSTIRAYLKLEDCSPTVRKLVASGYMSATGAAKLARLPKAEQDAEVASYAKEGKKPSSRVVLDRVREKEGKKPIQTPARRMSEAAAEFYALIAPLAAIIETSENEGVDLTVEDLAHLDRLAIVLCGEDFATLQKSVAAGNVPT